MLQQGPNRKSWHVITKTIPTNASVQIRVVRHDAGSSKRIRVMNTPRRWRWRLGLTNDHVPSTTPSAGPLIFSPHKSTASESRRDASDGTDTRDRGGSLATRRAALCASRASKLRNIFPASIDCPTVPLNCPTVGGFYVVDRHIPPSNKEFVLDPLSLLPGILQRPQHH